MVEKNEIKNSQDLNQIKQVSLETLSQQISDGEIKLNLIIKADVHGSQEAILHSIEKMNFEDVSINILHAGVGQITQNDISLATASQAIIIAFGYNEDTTIKQTAEQAGVSIKYYKIIYEILEDLQKAAQGMYTIETRETEIGRAEVRDIFKFSKIGIIAGSYVLDGKIQRNAIAKVSRENKEIHVGKIESLKRFKDDVKDVNSGYECGIVLENFNDIQESDIITAYILEEIKPQFKFMSNRIKRIETLILQNISTIIKQKLMMNVSALSALQMFMFRKI